MRTREKHQIANALRVAAVRSHDLFPSAVKARLDQVDFIIIRRTVLCIPKLACKWIENQAEAVSNSIGIILSQVSALGKERVVARGTAIIIDAKNHSCVIRSCTARDILQLSIAVQLSDYDIELTIGTKRHRTAIMVRPGGGWQIRNQYRT